MSKKAFKSQASSSRAFSGNPLLGSGSAFGSSAATPFSQGPGSSLSYIYEPPDLSSISDPAVGVSLKNLQKKDSTTKYKALEDLQSYVAVQDENKQGLEESFVEAWTKLFPRTAIDNSNRVRQLTYALHGKIATTCGKGFIKHMPSTVGAWLAGTFDRERQVSRAARESLASTFSTEEKRKNVWRAFQESILGYCLETIQKETVQSLSDERTSSPDDAQAKYSRAVGGALLTIAGLLDVLSSDDHNKQAEGYQEVLQSEAVWKFSASSDAGLRRAVYRLAISAMEKLPKLLDLAKVGNALLKQLSGDQLGSAYEFIRALTEVTRVEPSIWTSLYAAKSKKGSSVRLINFLSKGSFGVGPEFYKQLTILMELVPMEALNASDGDVESSSLKILVSLRDGITGSGSGRRDSEMQPQEAWKCFLKIARRVLEKTQDPAERTSIVEQAMSPIVLHYIEANLVASGRNWPQQKDLVSSAFLLSWEFAPEYIEKVTKDLSHRLVECMQTSLSEQSKGFSLSQEKVASSFSIWYGLQASVVRSAPDTTDLFAATAFTEVSAATELLKARNCKPFGAARALELLVAELPETSLRQARVNDMLQRFAKDTIPTSMQSPSASAFLGLLEAFGPSEETRIILDRAVSQLLALPRSKSRSDALQYLALSYWPSSAEESEKLTAAITEDLHAAMHDENAAWALPLATLKSKSAPAGFNDKILSQMMSGLSVENEIPPTLDGFHRLINGNNDALHTFADSSSGSQLLTRLISLSHHADEVIARKSTTLRDAVGSMISGGRYNPVISMIRTNLLSTESNALSVTSLWEQTQRYLDELPAAEIQSAIIELLPDLHNWEHGLQTFLVQYVDPDYAVTDSLGGAVYLLRPGSDTTARDFPRYDSDGFSAPLRAAVFIARLLNFNVTAFMAYENTGKLFELLALSSLFLGDHISYLVTVPIFGPNPDRSEADLVQDLSDLQDARNLWLDSCTNTTPLLLVSMLHDLLSGAEGNDIASYHRARALMISIEGLNEGQKLPAQLLPDEETYIRVRKEPRLFIDLVQLTTIPSSQPLLKLFNGLISDLAGMKSSSDKHVIQKYVALNIILKHEMMALEEVPKQRMVFFVKTAVNLLQENLPAPLKAEIFKSLSVLPSLADIYDEFWGAIVVQIAMTIRDKPDDNLSTAHAALQALNTIQRILRAGSNEDLEEAWAEHKVDIQDSLVDMLQNQSKSTKQASQASLIVHELLYRQLSNLTFTDTTMIADVLPVLSGHSVTLQRAAYHILESLIAEVQGQVSLDAALSSEYQPKLPQNILDIVSEIPGEDELVDLKARSEMPPLLSRYFFAWKLIFAHWTLASYKVRAAYVELLKIGAQLDKLLYLIFTELIEVHGGRNKAGYDPSRLPSLVEYRLDNAENPEQECLWLLCNIYYNVLLHTPYLARSWQTNHCPRALKSYVETWTTKWMSPLVIAEEFRVVSEWKPPSDDPGSELTMKISSKAAEMTASLPLDETLIAVKVHLPSAYPLAPIELSTAHRVGIDERKWQAFLNTSRIVMNFASTSQGQGAVIDGISTWRNNVLGALKGHTECAICYSVVAEDGKVPNKKCATCSHLFHSLCLYKWFQRSAGSTCPLCRNAFNYA